MPVPRSPDAVRAERKVTNTLQSMQFPSDLGDTGMLLLFKEYSYKERETGGPGGVQSVTAAGAILDSIYLPLPEQLLDATQVKVGGQEIGILGAVTAQGSRAITSAIGSASISPILDALGGVEAGKTLAAGAANFMKQGLEAVGLGGAQRGIEAGMGAVANPYQALVFEGVDLKVFMLNWTFAPKSRAETMAIKNVINTIKKHSLPYYKNVKIGGSIGGTINAGRAFLNYPSVCIPLITGVNTITFKPCMVSQIQVDYNGGGELAFLEGGNPAAVKVNMTLQEMQIWTREDYTGKETDPSIAVTYSAMEGTE